MNPYFYEKDYKGFSIWVREPWEPGDITHPRLMCSVGTEEDAKAIVNALNYLGVKI
jgi:hypothetical protein